MPTFIVLYHRGLLLAWAISFSIIPRLCQLMKLGRHLVPNDEYSRSTSSELQLGQGGAGAVEVGRYSSNSVSHLLHWYS